MSHATKEWDVRRQGHGGRRASAWRCARWHQSSASTSLLPDGCCPVPHAAPARSSLRTSCCRFPGHVRLEKSCPFSETSFRPSASRIDATEPVRSEEHTSELQSLMRISYAVFCWNKKT